MWARVINIGIGMWLMAAPGILGYGSTASDNGHIFGPVIATFAIISCWEATRGVRKWIYPHGLWLLLAPWILNYEMNFAIISDMSCGIIILILASFKGEIHNRYGGGWKVLWE